MAKKMYFGTREYMTWIKCPAIDAGMSSVGWQSVIQYLNGGASVRRSSTAHRVYDFAWPMASYKDADIIRNFANNVYGDGLVYFLDPFAVQTNLLPTYWASPRLAVDDAPPLVIDRRPTLTNTAVNTLAYPTKSAVYELREGDNFASLYIPVPPGYTFHLGVHGSSTGSATVKVIPEGPEFFALTEDPVGSGLYTAPPSFTEDEPGLYLFTSGLTEVEEGLYATEIGAAAVEMLSPTSYTRTNFSLANATGVTITLDGVGYLTLAGLIAQVLPDGQIPETGGFIGGQGHSGCRMDGYPEVMGYSSPQAIDKQSVSLTLIETGAWE